jgi:hypothetical protein
LSVNAVSDSISSSWMNLVGRWLGHPGNKAILPAIALLVAPCLIAQTPAPSSLSGTAETDFVSRYIYRGFAWSQGPVMEPYASVIKGSLTFGAWANVVLGNAPQGGTLNESDFTLVWSHNHGNWRVEPMVEYWSDRPVHGGSDNGDGEISVRISRSVKGPIRIFTNQAYDVFRHNGSYYGEGGPDIAGTWEKFDVELNGHLAWASAEFNRVYAGIAISALNLASVDGSATRKLGSHGLYMRLHFEASRLLDSQVRHASGNGTLAAAGLAIGFKWGK